MYYYVMNQIEKLIKGNKSATWLPLCSLVLIEYDTINIKIEKSKLLFNHKSLYLLL